jgi:uncharacterized protein (DUF1501 family)
LLDQMSAKWATLGPAEKIVVGATGLGMMAVGFGSVGLAFSATAATSGAAVALLELAEYGGGLAHGVLAVKLATSVGINSAIEAPRFSDPTSLGQALSAPLNILGAGVRDTVLKEFVSKIDEIISTPAY